MKRVTLTQKEKLRANALEMVSEKLALNSVKFNVFEHRFAFYDYSFIYYETFIFFSGSLHLCIVFYWFVIRLLIN